MSRILVPPNVLLAVADQFDRASNQLEATKDSLNNQISMLMVLWDGTTRQRFFEDFQRTREEMKLTINHMQVTSQELKNIAYRFMQVDGENGGLDPRCAAPIPNVDSRNRFEKSIDSLKELGNGIMDASNERYDKRYSSVWSFLDYWTAGIPKGAYQGYVERADKLFESPNDFANGMTFGVHGTIREAILPTNAWSTEHVASMIGTAGLLAGVTGSLIKPKDVLSPPVKYEVKGNHGLKHDSGGDGGGTPKKNEGMGNVNRTEPSLPKGGKPKGKHADEVDRGIKRQNETADLLAENGYDIEMLDEINGGNGYGINPESNPDFLIEGKPFDCYSPDSNTSIDNVSRAITKKTKNQTESIILNLDDFPLEKVNDLFETILRKTNPNGDLKRLQELFVVKDGIITKLFVR